MKADTQHLDYLISQYVDGCLDTGNKKSLEQKLMNDPQARKSYQQQREVQDMLDDWGNRIPMINWNQFDKELAGRLEHETVGGRGISIFRRWAKPMSVAAGLLLAVSVGYGWHAMSNPARVADSTNITPATTLLHARDFSIDDRIANKNGSLRVFSVEEPNGNPAVAAASKVEIFSPDDVAAVNSLQNAIRNGLGGDIKQAGVVMATPGDEKKEKDSKTETAVP